MIPAPLPTPVAGVATALVVLVVAAWGRHLPQQRGRLVARGRLAPDAGRVATRPAIGGSTRAGPVPRWWVTFVERAGLTDVVDATRAWPQGPIVGLATIGVVGWLLGPAVAALVVGATVAGPHLVGPWLRERQARRLEAQLPIFLDGIASGLRSGSSLTVGVLEAAQRVPAPLGLRLAPVVAGVRAGSPLEVELDRWHGRQHSAPVRMVVAALVLGLGAGGPQADTIDAIGDTVRERLALAGETRALAAQARASAVVIVAAPVVFAVVSAVADPGVLHFLVATPAGLACVAGGLTLDGIGAAWMGSITRAAR